VSRSPLTWWAVSVARDGSTAAVRVAEADSVTTAWQRTWGDPRARAGRGQEARGAKAL